jgi:hypothetical protein
MKLIKKATKKINKPLVGDIVRIKFFYDDGRGVECTIAQATVVKVNRVTFDFKKNNGDIYRIKFNDPDIVDDGDEYEEYEETAFV